jgi:glutamate 5-kinase
MRVQVTRAKRIVVKVGSSSLTTASGGLDPSRLADLVTALATLPQEIVLVSSGAIAAGLAPLGLRRRPRDLATQQAAASVGQGRLVHAYTEEFGKHGRVVGQVLMTVDDVTRRAHYRNAFRTLRKLLDMKVIPVINENDTVATEEIRFGDNDRLAALVAALVQADLLVLLSDVDALYTGDPALPDSRRIATVRDFAKLADISVGGVGRSGVGTGGMVTKVEAARIASGAGIPVILTSASLAAQALRGEAVGTLFSAGVPGAARLHWLAHATTPRGRLTLDAGAVTAVVDRRASLLPAGVTAVEGAFIAGDPVDLLDTSGRAVARGLSNYDALELPALLGKSGHTEVIHRDDLVLL